MIESCFCFPSFIQERHSLPSTSVRRANKRVWDGIATARHGVSLWRSTRPMWNFVVVALNSSLVSSLERTKDSFTGRKQPATCSSLAAATSTRVMNEDSLSPPSPSFHPFIYLYSLLRGAVVCKGVAVTAGTRYILTGFCTYGPSAEDADPHESFMREYDAEADGSAAGAGIRTGDILRGVFLPPPALSSIGATETLVPVNDLSREELQELIQRAAVACEEGRERRARNALCLLMERTHVVVGDDDSEARRTVIREANHLFSVGAHWSVDDALKSATTNPAEVDGSN